ncbi:MAG TPA: Hint domain-containing protein [Planctomycetota bacterium]|nr:Hint domain-containing protein [Planctomycetota bacterium]
MSGSYEREPRIGCALVFVILVALGVAVAIPDLVTHRRCVVEGTLIATPSGPRPIESLRIGDAVVSRGPDGSESVSHVVATVEAPVDEFLELTFENGRRLEVTATHPVASGGSWIEAGFLREGDRAEAREGTTKVRHVLARRHPVRVFDITVQPDACFFAAGILVHNKTSNEAAAIGSLKTFAMSEAVYHENYDPPRFASLAELSSAKLIDGVLGSGTKQGYVFAVEPSSTEPALSWFATARPVLPGTTGDRYFVTNERGVIFYTTAAPFAVDPSICAIPSHAVPIGK